jgi:hypothetical protein
MAKSILTHHGIQPRLRQNLGAQGLVWPLQISNHLGLGVAVRKGKARTRHATVHPSHRLLGESR